MVKTKICHIAQSEGGGVTEYIKQLVSKLDKRYYDITIIGSTYYEVERDYLESQGCKLITIKMIRNINALDDVKSILKLRKILKDLKPDIVHIHSSKAGALARVAHLGFKSKVVYNAHGWAFNMKVGKLKKRLYQNIERMLSYFCDMIINISEDEYKSAVEVGINKKKMIIIKNAIDIDKAKQQYCRSDVLEELIIPNTAYIIGICGRLSDQKAPETFLKICKRIKEEIPNSYFVMIGDGELKEKVLRIAKEYKIEDRLRITGWVNETQKYISILDIALLTSRWEGFGLVLLEYMAQNKPIIAAKVGGVPEIIQSGENGILVEREDVQAYVEAIMHIKEDTVYRNKLISKAEQVLESEYSLQRIVKAHEELYASINRV